MTEKMFDIHLWHKEILKSRGKLTIKRSRCFGKKSLSTRLLTECLSRMKVGETFGYATPDGLKIFKLEEIRESKK